MIAPILYILDCDHVMPGPKGVTVIDCLNCDKEVTIRDVHEFEWHVICTQNTCTFGKWTGLSKGLAEYHANSHANKHPLHQVKVLYQPNPESKKVKDIINGG